MFKPTDAAGFRRSAIGAALIVSPLFQLTATLVDPGTWSDDDREVATFAVNPAMAQLQSALYHWSWVLLPLAALGLLHLTRRRGVVLGHIGGLFAALGFINLSALLMGDAVEWWFGRHYPADQAEKLFNEVFDLPGVVFSFQMPWVFLGPLGLILIMVALTRAGFVRWWIPAAGALVWISPYVMDYGPLSFLWSGGNVLVLGYLGLKILRMGDRAWASYYPSPVPGVTTPDSYANTTA
ncbi:hypothetical protein [Microbispora sp. ATCC PTA-5024]|uniref:hypothetical protein n=1 Tax=Microbispora sp. ATCC PTA-5024 TaxID=316330 RepID=UPI0003DC11C9|nr:hypothetical protein [Microbispora sp. ATCC PTA-5024]ETK36052.1 hypothetical protein MPTA5024_10535 [Microbispora sp. ATCC PTA-5024]